MQAGYKGKKMNEKYCYKCGQELIKIGIARYDSHTGEPIYDMKCPTNLCRHHGVAHEHIRISFFNYKCKNCGHCQMWLFD